MRISIVKAKNKIVLLIILFTLFSCKKEKEDTVLEIDFTIENHSYAHLVAHELAHSWSGNLITNAT